jgi:hypothetical protein
MTEHYVTLFDSLYLPQGLALHSSLERHAGNYQLWVLCVDDIAFEILQKLKLSNVSLISLKEVETKELCNVKQSRTIAEYCWTLTPFTFSFVFERDAKAERVTYLDADTWLLHSPRPLFAELEVGTKSVLITEHGYAPQHDQAAISGRYCVQFVTFVRGGGDEVLHWWQERCLEWCYSRVEDGKFGDQKYLDEWPTRFSKTVHVLREKALCQAPWNVTRFPPSEAIFFHFHGLRLLTGQNVLLADGSYEIPYPTFQHIYSPYLSELASVNAKLIKVGFIYRSQIKKTILRLKIEFLGGRLKRWGLRLFFGPSIHKIGGVIFGKSTIEN